jgi:hypothetical protein
MESTPSWHNPPEAILASRALAAAPPAPTVGVIRAAAAAVSVRPAVSFPAGPGYGFSQTQEDAHEDLGRHRRQDPAGQKRHRREIALRELKILQKGPGASGKDSFRVAQGRGFLTVRRGPRGLRDLPYRLGGPGKTRPCSRTWRKGRPGARPWSSWKSGGATLLTKPSAGTGYPPGGEMRFLGQGRRKRKRPPRPCAPCCPAAGAPSPGRRRPRSRNPRTSPNQPEPPDPDRVAALCRIVQGRGARLCT